MKAGRPWTTAELERVRRWYLGGLEAAQIARTIGRTEASVRCKLEQLGIHKRRPWTPEEDAVLRQWRPMTIADVAHQMGRSVGAVRQRRRRLGRMEDHEEN